jgi:hypothetical protein
MCQQRTDLVRMPAFEGKRGPVLSWSLPGLVAARSAACFRGEQKRSHHLYRGRQKGFLRTIWQDLVLDTRYRVRYFRNEAFRLAYSS